MKFKPEIVSVLALFVSMVVADAGFTETVQLRPSKDNTLYESDSGDLSNGAGDHIFAGMTGQPGLRRALIAFDLNVPELPAGSTIDDVTLKLRLSKQSPSAGEDKMTLHRVLADWGEGDSDAPQEEGMGGDAETNDATWTHRFFNTSEVWTNEGGDFSDTESASFLVDGRGAYTVGSTPGMVQDVQAWLDEPKTNFGWMIRGDESGNFTARRFDSREISNEDFQPLLTIDFTRIQNAAGRWTYFD